jgi:hypothetical protein
VICLIERQELWCHECHNYVQFDIDLSLNGNHVLNCPNCGHEHCRVVEDGIITGERWDSRNNSQSNITYYPVSTSGITFSSSSTYDMYKSSYGTGVSTGNLFTYGSWMNVVSSY